MQIHRKKIFYSSLIIYLFTFFTILAHPSLYEEDTNQAKIGPVGFKIIQPIHETLTIISLQNAGYLKSKFIKEENTAVDPYEHFSDKEYFDYIRGVVWNDDPECSLFLGENPSNFKAVSWFADYLSAEISTKNDSKIKNLTGRSHFGDLQFLHSMEESSGIQARNTYDKIINWTEFLFNVIDYRGNEPFDLKVSDFTNTPLIVSILGVNSNSKDSLTNLFCIRDERTLFEKWFTNKEKNNKKAIESLRMRAIGSLLHLIQDSFMKGHVERNEKSFSVNKYLTYKGQDKKKHSQYDSWDKSKKTIGEKISSLNGGDEAIKKGTELLKILSGLNNKGITNNVKNQYQNKIIEIFKPIDDTIQSDKGNF